MPHDDDPYGTFGSPYQQCPRCRHDFPEVELSSTRDPTTGIRLCHPCATDLKNNVWRKMIANAKAHGQLSRSLPGLPPR